MARRSTVSDYRRYGILGVPLAFASLPLYVHVPAFYARATPLGLATIGGVLLLVRLLDTISDPIIGALSDRYGNRRTTLMACAVPVLAVSFLLLLSPPADVDASFAALWLALCLAGVYAGFSILMINYYAWGVTLSHSEHEHTRIAAWREGSMLLGVMLASLLPAWLLQYFSFRDAYRIYGLVLAGLLPLCACIALSVRVTSNDAPIARFSPFRLLRDRDVRWVLLVVFFNAIPAALTSTLFLFFVADVLGAQEQSGLLLAVYFISAVLGMPVWSRLSKQYGKARSLAAAMLMAIVAFFWAFFLHRGDVATFYAICVFSGLTLGADAVLLPSMFADRFEGKKEETGAGFGWWNFLSKMTMALAAGITLPALALAGYRPGPGNTGSGLAFLSFCYALLPCGFKLAAATLLFVSRIEGNLFAQIGWAGRAR